MGIRRRAADPGEEAELARPAKKTAGESLAYPGPGAAGIPLRRVPTGRGAARSAGPAPDNAREWRANIPSGAACRGSLGNGPRGYRPASSSSRPATCNSTTIARLSIWVKTSGRYATINAHVFVRADGRAAGYSAQMACDPFFEAVDGAEDQRLDQRGKTATLQLGSRAARGKAA